MIYFDNAATTKPDERVVDAMLPYLCDRYGNASTLYPFGQECKKAIENARVQISELINCLPEEIIFTSGGSEADSTVIKNYGSGGIVTSTIEHKAIIYSCLELMDEDIRFIDVNKNGFVYLDELECNLRDLKHPRLCSIMYANNEIGTIQPISDISEISHRFDIPFHTDAVQAFGHIPIDVKRSGIDMLSASAHKINGPKGVGCLYIKKEIQKNLLPLINGGKQEFGLRASTENVAGIVGFGKACEIAKYDMADRMYQTINIRNYFMEKISSIDGVFINGIDINGNLEQYRLPNNINVRISGVDNVKLQSLLAEKDICCSTGSACNSGNKQESHVLKAIGLSPDEAGESIRFTFSSENTKSEVNEVIKWIKTYSKILRKKG